VNYRHVYHAGGFGDVVKHLVLTAVIERLKAKPAPFVVLDTHAGIGCYDLASAEAARTLEFETGITRLLACEATQPRLQPDAARTVARHLGVVRALNPEGASLRWYPGSPRLARALLRPCDRLVMCELHPQDILALKAEFAADPQAAVHHMDGYRALKAHLPPRERRGVVLLDPPFEAPDEHERLVAGLAVGHRRWPTGIFAIWYPIKERPAIWRFHQRLEETGIRKILAAEITIHPEETHERLNGCGMVLVNPPWRLDAALSDLLAGVHPLLTLTGGGTRVDWLVPE
jgi:23S rRNA (adenine2030-N6)-methyltransferase